MKQKLSPRRWAGNICLLLGCVLFGGAATWFAGQDISAETLSHTFYLPYAFLKGKLHTDIAAAGAVYSFQNPFLYLPYYLLFTIFNNRPALSTFLQGIPAGIFLFLAWKICRLSFRPFKTKKYGLFYLCVFWAAVTGLATADQLGRSNGQFYLLCAYAGALYLFLSKKDAPAHIYGAFFIAGLLVGLSPTALPFAVGLGLAAGAWAYAQNAGCFKKMTAAALCFLLGWGLWAVPAWASGADRLGLWQAALPQGWPFFAGAHWQEVPLNWREWVLLPWQRLRYFFPQYTLDARLLLGLLSALFLTADFLFRPVKTRWRNYNLFWAVFFLVAYAMWLFCLRDNASSVLLEFSAIIVFARLLLTALRPVSAQVFMIAALLLLSLQSALNGPRQGLENKNFYFSPVPKIEENAFVLTAGKTAGLLPFLPNPPRQAAQIWLDPQDYPPSARRKLSRFNDMPAAHYTHRFDKQITQALAAHTGPVYVLAPKTDLLQENKLWQRYGLYMPAGENACQYFANNSTAAAQKGFMLCRLSKTAAHSI